MTSSEIEWDRILREAEQAGYDVGVKAVRTALEKVLAAHPLPPRRICGLVLENAGPNGEPLACAWEWPHLPESPHSWASLPTRIRIAEGSDVLPTGGAE